MEEMWRKRTCIERERKEEMRLKREIVFGMVSNFALRADLLFKRPRAAEMARPAYEEAITLKESRARLRAAAGGCLVREFLNNRCYTIRRYDAEIIYCFS